MVQTKFTSDNAAHQTIPGINAMNLIVLVIILLILFGGGGFYYGGPYVGGGLGTVLLIILIVLLLRWPAADLLPFEDERFKTEPRGPVTEYTVTGPLSYGFDEPFGSVAPFWTPPPIFFAMAYRALALRIGKVVRQAAT